MQKSYLNTENTRAILPIALILLRITSFRRLAAVPIKGKALLKSIAGATTTLLHDGHELV